MFYKMLYLQVVTTEYFLYFPHIISMNFGNGRFLLYYIVIEKEHVKKDLPISFDVGVLANTNNVTLGHGNAAMNNTCYIQ